MDWSAEKRFCLQRFCLLWHHNNNISFLINFIFLQIIIRHSDLNILNIKHEHGFKINLTVLVRHVLAVLKIQIFLMMTKFVESLSNHEALAWTAIVYNKHTFFKNGLTPASFSFIFNLFRQTTEFYNKSMWKNVMSIQYMAPGFEPRPLEHESSPLTTRPGLPPNHKHALVEGA